MACIRTCSNALRRSRSGQSRQRVSNSNIVLGAFTSGTVLSGESGSALVGASEASATCDTERGRCLPSLLAFRLRKSFLGVPDCSDISAATGEADGLSGGRATADPGALPLSRLVDTACRNSFDVSSSSGVIAAFRAERRSCSRFVLGAAASLTSSLGFDEPVLFLVAIAELAGSESNALPLP